MLQNIFNNLIDNHIWKKTHFILSSFVLNSWYYVVSSCDIWSAGMMSHWRQYSAQAKEDPRHSFKCSILLIFLKKQIYIRNNKYKRANPEEKNLL